jgi:choline-sulfatase
LAKAGPGTTEEIAVDEQAEAAALAYLRDPARRQQPWALNVSFIAPHFPLVVPQRFWDLYPPETVDLPHMPAGHLAAQHPVYQRLRHMFGMVEFPEALTRRGRAAYYGLITYLDEKVGRLLAALEAMGQRDDTLVVYTADHGEMAGEHGMWRKSNFYEHSARVPLILSWPAGLPRGRVVPQVVATVDTVATMVQAAGAPLDVAPLDGASLLSLARGEGDAGATWKDEAFGEYLAHGVARPMAMLRRGHFKLNYSLDDPVELYDLAADPGELRDLAESAEYAGVREALRSALLAHWDPVVLEQQVRQSQRERLLIRAAQRGQTVQTMSAETQRTWYASGSTGGARR